MEALGKLSFFILLVCLLHQCSVSTTSQLTVSNSAQDRKLTNKDNGILDIEYLTEYEGKSYYLDRSIVSQSAARSSCLSRSLDLVDFPRGQEELNFIRAFIPINVIGQLWTNFKNVQNHTDYESSAGVPVPREIPVQTNAEGLLGLTFSRTSTRLSVAPVYFGSPFVCFGGRIPLID